LLSQNNRSHKVKNITRFEYIQNLFESCNRKLSLSYIVVLLSFKEYMNGAADLASYGHE